ncbi:hypothetical protein [Paenibacillus terrigena]|uniref:hypothetical protein n=1 Tax=Paenibacillus terrigena TaxID=369333 RepID=UPI0003822F9D|nr:hypothetical protein [Paenibacillus terrigena]
MSVVIDQEKIFRLKDISIELYSLDLEDGENLEMLSLLQEEQEKLREELTDWMPRFMKDENLKEVIQECIFLEQRLGEKLINQRAQAQDQILRMQAGTRSKNAYSSVFHQTEGYFVDKKK